MTRTSWLKAIMNDPQLDWARSRRMRRALVVTYLALIAALVAVLIWAGEWEPGVAGALAMSLIPQIFIMGALNGSIRGLSELSARDLDERERQVRDPVYRRLYHVAALGGLAAGLVASGMDIAFGSRLAIFYAAYMLIWGAPVLVLAWTLPDDPEEEALA